MAAAKQLDALVIGATGATGRFLVTALLQHPDYTSVNTFVRKPSGVAHPKLKEHVIDFAKPEQYESFVRGDVLFSVLGTTLKAAGSKAAQWQIDFEIPARFARLASQHGVPAFVLLSAAGAAANSAVFYSKMKGTLEDDIASLNFEQYIIFRPGMLDRPATDRPGEKLGVAVLRGLNKLGLFRKYRPLPVQLLAQKLALAPLTAGPGKTVISLAEIAKWSGEEH